MHKIKVSVQLLLFVLATVFVFKLQLFRPTNEEVAEKPNITKIAENYHRNVWWAVLLCEPILEIKSNMSDLIPLKVLNKEVQSNPDYTKNIFFLENNCQTKVSFYVQCALESAATKNPEATIFLITVVPVLEDSSKTILKLLEKFKNIQIVQGDYDIILQDTPLEMFRSKEIWTTISRFLRGHVSDAMRVALLWKEGGAYLDTDVISIKKFPAQDKVIERLMIPGINNEVLKFPKHHEYLSIVMNYMKAEYDKNWWPTIGAEATTAAADMYCNETVYETGICKDITVLDSEAYTRIWWDHAEDIVKPNWTGNWNQFLESPMLGIHTNHFILEDRLNEPKDDSLYQKITMEFCPLTYWNHYTDTLKGRH